MLKISGIYVFAVGYTMDVVAFSWLENAVEIDEDVQLPQFDLKDVTQRDCSQNYTAGRYQAHVRKTFLRSYSFHF